MPAGKHTYAVQVADDRRTLWIHCTDGSTVARFSLFGIDLHNTITDQLAGAPQCRLCTHGTPTPEQWQLFREKALEWFGLQLDPELISSTVFQRRLTPRMPAH